MNTFLKQCSLMVFSFALLSWNVQAADWSSVFENANSAIDATKFIKDDQSKKDILQLNEHLGWGLYGKKTSDAYKDVKKQVSRLSDRAKSSVQGIKKEAEDAMSAFEQEFKGNVSIFSGEALEATKKGITEDIKQKAKEMATGKEIGRFLNERVTSEMKQMGDRTNEEGPGFATLDPANVVTGMYNLDSVFGENLANGGVRTQDTKSCSSMGLADAQRGDSLGMACCLKWVMGSGEEASDSGSDSIALFIDALTICCAMAPDYCVSWLDTAQEKAACVNGSLSTGMTMAESWKTCEVECGKKGYGELVHNENGEYDPTQVEDFLKECYNMSEDIWQPSPTVLTASEMAPVVPEEVKVLLQ